MREWAGGARLAPASLVLILLLAVSGCGAGASAAQPAPVAPGVPTTQSPRQEPAVSAAPALTPRSVSTPPATTLAPAPRPAASGTETTTLQAQAFSVQEYDVPSGSHPHDVAPAADGGIWYTAQDAGVLGRLDPASGKTQQIPLGQNSAPHGVIVGPDQAAWVTDGGLNAIVRVDAQTREVKRYGLPADRTAANLNTAVFDQTGKLWFTGQNGIYGVLDPATGKMQVYDAPKGFGPYGITVTPAGKVYYASLSGSYVGEIDPTTGQVKVLEPPTAGQGARRVWSDSGGRVWVSEWTAGQLARYDPATRAWKEWRLPGAQPSAYAVYVESWGSQGSQSLQDRIWLSDFGDNALVRFDPGTEKFASIPLPSPAASVRQLNGRPGEIWGAESAVDKLVVVRER